ncbi:MAG: phenylalanine--tRNA ligase subunit beta [bacterium]
MKISYNWLKNYVPDLPSPEKLAEVFTFHVCEIESIDKLENGDTVLDIKVLPDRAHDLLSHIGVARDIAGVLGLSFKETKYEVPVGDTTKLEIKIETDKCRRYMGRIVRNVAVGPSPEWVKNYLETLGQRSINNLVDATNIVMFDLGNPIHIFDLDKLSSEKIIVRQAHDIETMTTLDNKEIKFTPLNMVIADERDILAIAGVKGGKVAEVDNNTKNIVIEVANFDPTSVRKTAKAVNIYTDAVKRYENDLSPEVASGAMDEITALILEMCKSAKVEEVVDKYPKKTEKKTLTFSLSKISKILGLTVTDVEAENILKNFKREYKKSGDVFEMVVPDNRPDLASDEDMAEEIGRVIGYDKIKAELPVIKNVAKSDENFSKIMIAREKLLNDGYSEVMTYVFGRGSLPAGRQVEVLASASDKKFLRNNLTDGLLESLKLNQLNAPFLEMKEIKIFEIGTVFFKDREEMHVAYNEKKNIVEKTLEDFILKMPDVFSERSGRDRDPGNRGPEEKIYNVPKKFTNWSIYPFISRDVAVWVPEGESSDVLKNILKENGTDLLVKEPYLFDSFTKDGKTSYAFRLVFQSYDRTLTDAEINDIMTKINQKVSENSDWQIR